MASLGNPKTWVPYMNSKDCSQGFCSLYCPQWCYVIYPPPPPFEFPDDNSSTSFSPLVIAIIGILASAFLLVSYYTIISKYCGSPDSARRRNYDPNEELEDNHNPSLHEPWQVPTTGGLDEALIKSITVCKYKNGDGLVEVTDCSVCLSEFQEDENVRLLPKCSHAFHLSCIDTWLKSHSNCPLCRANVFSFNALPLQFPAPVVEITSSNETLPESQHTNENEAVGRDNERDDIAEERLHNGIVPKPALRAFSDLGNLQSRNTIIQIRDEGYESVRRSLSMDHSFQSHVSVADILHMNQDEDIQVDQNDAQSQGETSKSNYRRVLHCVLSPVAMKRSFSSGRFFLTRHGRGRHAAIPV